MYGIFNADGGQDDTLICQLVAPMTIESNAPAFTSDSLNLRRFSSSLGVQRWELKTQILATNDSAMFAHLMRKGTQGAVLVKMPPLINNIDVESSVAIITLGVSLSGLSTVHVSAAAGDLAIGTFFNFSGFAKLYTIVDMSPRGDSITVYPPLTKDIPSGTPLEYGNAARLHGCYDIDTLRGITYKDGVLSDFGEIKIIEDLNA